MKKIEKLNRTTFLNEFWSSFPSYTQVKSSLITDEKLLNYEIFFKGRFKDLKIKLNSCLNETQQNDILNSAGSDFSSENLTNQNNFDLHFYNDHWFIVNDWKQNIHCLFFHPMDIVAVAISANGKATPKMNELIFSLLAPYQVQEQNSISDKIKIKLSEDEFTSTKKDFLILWDQFIFQTETFFRQKNFLKVSTPTLVVCPGTEPFLDVFQTELHVNSLNKRKMYLPTSPELNLKKMLTRGYDQIFEIRPCFRNGEVTDIHQPEFWMLEWYRTYADLNEIQADVQDLILFLCSHFKKSPPQFEKITCKQAFEKYLDLELAADADIHELKILVLNNLKSKHLYSQIKDYDLWDDVYYSLFLQLVEPELLKDYSSVFLHEYPPSQAALARLTNSGWGDRFEYYWKGLEIANAFHELNDPKIQWERTNQDLATKAKINKEIPNLDESFFQHLQAGMPPSAGIALGLERLFMAIFDIKNITSFKEFYF